MPTTLDRQARPGAMFLTESATARLLGIHPSTLHRLAHAGKAPVEPVWMTEHTRRYRRRDVERLAGLESGA